MDVYRPIWFRWKMAAWTQGNVGNSRSMEHLGVIFGFIGAMVVSPMFSGLKSPFCREPRTPTPPEFCWVNHVQHWGLPNSHHAGAMDSVQMSRILWGVSGIPLDPQFFHGHSGSPKNHTPRKINMEPKNHPIEKENYLPNHHFQVPC